MLQVQNIVRHFGAVKAVDGLSFTLERGQSVGLIGANGAGKTTTMRLLTTLDLPDAGTITFDGVDAVAWPEKVRSRIGWMPDGFDPMPHMTIRDMVDFFARAYGLTGTRRKAEVERVLAFCGLDDLADRFINKLSKGQSQRMSLARTIIGDPDMLVLDEPAAGLDPVARIEFKQFVRQLQAEGKTLLISSHILSELAEMCDSMLFMDKGKIIRQGTLAELTHEEGTRISIRMAGQPAALAQWLLARPCWKSATPAGPDAVLAVYQPPAAAGTPPPTPAEEEERLALELRAMSADFLISGFTRSQRNLEETFVSILHDRHE